MCGELPSGRDAQVVVAVVIPVADDIETLRIEAADSDTAAAQIHRGCADIDVFEQPFASSQVVTDDGVDHHLGTGHFVVLTE